MDLKYSLLLFFTFSFLCTNSIVYSQSNYALACEELRDYGQNAEYSKDTLKFLLAQVQKAIIKSTPEELEKCRCTDSLWIAHFNFEISPQQIQDAGYINKLIFLKRIISSVDSTLLYKKLEAASPQNLLDSLTFVMNHHKEKDLLRYASPTSWKDHYHMQDQESAFIRNHNVKLKDHYWEVFDDELQSDETRDLMLMAFWYGDPNVEEELLARLPNYIESKYFYRMIGMLRNNGADDSVYYLTELLENQSLDIKQTKSILQIIYEIVEKKSVKKMTENHWKNFLIKSKLDSFSRIDLYR